LLLFSFQDERKKDNPENPACDSEADIYPPLEDPAIGAQLNFRTIQPGSKKTSVTLGALPAPPVEDAATRCPVKFMAMTSEACPPSAPPLGEAGGRI